MEPGANDVKNGSCGYSIRSSTLIGRVGGMPWLKTGATHYHAQLGLIDKGRAIKELVVYWVLHYLIFWTIKHVTILLQVMLRWRGEDLYPKFL